MAPECWLRILFCNLPSWILRNITSSNETIVQELGSEIQNPKGILVELIESMLRNREKARFSGSFLADDKDMQKGPWEPIETFLIHWISHWEVIGICSQVLNPSSSSRLSVGSYTRHLTFWTPASWKCISNHQIGHYLFRVLLNLFIQQIFIAYHVLSALLGSGEQKDNHLDTHELTL